MTAPKLMLKALVAAVFCISALACARPVKLRPEVLAATAKLKETVPAPAWSLPLEAPFADLLEPIGEDAVLVGALTWTDKFAAYRRGPLMLLDLATGKQRWKVEAAALPSGQSVVVTSDPCIVIATITGDAMMVTGIERESGTLLWNRRFGRRSAYVLSPVLARPAIVVVDDQAVHAVELATGVNRWSSPIAASATPLGFSAWLAEPAVYVITDRLQRLSIDGGRLDWTSNENVDGPVTQAIRISDQLITVGSAAVTSFSTVDGRVTWRHAREGLKPISVGMAGVNLLVAWTHTTSAIASELTLHDTVGTLIWHSEPLAEIHGGPVIDDDGFIVVTSAAQAMRIDARSGAMVAKAKLPLELVSKRGLPDYLSFHNRNLLVRRERGVAVVDLATMKVEWSMPVFAGRAIEWSVSERLHNSWLLNNTAIPPTTAAVLTTARRAGYDALHELTLTSPAGSRLAAAETNAASDALHLYLAAQSQAYLDDGRASALFAGANMRSAVHDYFATGPAVLAAPVTFRE
ncbi:MAG TPA: PQQ-binding-like beta-propeller repeat protein, partial [Myxococcota bacterium]|nr:PQQ-binding-like beta-propeller repeat protein [Myxococcota bacterium]